MPESKNTSTSKNSSTLNDNKLLATLSPKSYKRLAPNLERVDLTVGDILYEQQGPMEFVYFPHRAMISIVNILKDNSMVELAVIGPEGMLGAGLLSEDDLSPHQAIVQTANGGLRMKAGIFLKEIKRGRELKDLVDRYSQAMFFQVAQTAACNSMHPIVERLARWLLLTQDIMGTDKLELTHEFIAHMLSVKRPSVTIAAGTLRAAGIIKYSRGKVTVVQRQELEESSCECYATIKAEYSRLLAK